MVFPGPPETKERSVKLVTKGPLDRMGPMVKMVRMVLMVKRGNKVTTLSLT